MKKAGVTRIVVVAIVAVILVGAVAGAVVWYLFPREVVKPQELEEVRVITDWMIEGDHSFLFAALEQGYYHDEGLAVVIYPGFGSTDAIKKIETGLVDFGYVDPGCLLKARAEGIKVKFIGSIMPSTTVAYNILNISGIKTPKDFEGKILGGASEDAAIELFPVFAKTNGIDVSKVTIQEIDYGVYRTLLFTGQIDICPGDIVADELEYGKMAKEEGMEHSMIRFIDWGLDLQGDGLITHERVINEKPDVVRRFLRATYKGLIYALDNPEKAIDYILKYSPEWEYDPEIALGGLTGFNKLVAPKIVRDDPPKTGMFDATKMKSTRDTIVEALGITVEIPLEDFYTNEFL